VASAAHRTNPQDREWRALGDRLTGEVLRPNTPAYEAARPPQIKRFRAISPQGIVRCATAADVAEAIAFARRHDVATATRSGGHCFAGHSSTDGLLIDVSLMNRMSLEGDTLTVGAGTRLGDLYRTLAGHGRAIPGGCGPTVGVSGLTLGGGFGILGRAHGLLCDSLTGASVVLADGRALECDADREADLFWALRGGGPDPPGVVTTLRFTTVPAPRCTMVDVAWNFEHAAAVLGAWQQWSPDAPEALAASLLITARADPSQPPRVTLFGAWAGRARQATALVDELASRAGATPNSMWLDERDWLATKRALNDRAPGEGEEGDMYHRSEFFGQSLPAEVVAELLGTLPPTAPRARRASLTSRRGAAPTTVWRATRPRSRTALRGTYSSTRP
jgi:FAD/FMN-containing dehydrogenase